MKFKVILTLLIVSVLVSCSEDASIFETVNTPRALQDLGPIEEVRPSPNNTLSNHMYGALVPGHSCGAIERGERVYTVYAAAGRVVNYDRTVNILIIQGNTLIDGKIVTIKANKITSENRSVFGNTTQHIGDVEVIVDRVTGNGQDLTGNIELRRTTYDVNNCTHSEPNLPDPNYCHGNDEDGDGICDNYDPDSDDGGDGGTGFVQ